MSSYIVLNSDVVKAVQAWPCANIPDGFGISEALGKTTHDLRLEAVHPDQGIFFFFLVPAQSNDAERALVKCQLGPTHTFPNIWAYKWQNAADLYYTEL